MLLFCLCKDPPPLEPSERLEEAAAPEFQAEPETIPAPDVEGVEEAERRDAVLSAIWRSLAEVSIFR